MPKESWPALPLDEWRDTYATLHLWTQVVGKICLALTPKTNHFWNIALQIGPRGLATPLMAYHDRSFAITFNFREHQLEIECSDGAIERLELKSRTVADFYAEVMARLRALGMDVKIRTMPVELPDPIPFDQDTVHHTYEPARAEAFWKALLAMKPVFENFRCEFIGKCSPVHFFWGSFDLAVTRFSGRRAPDRPGADPITRDSYSHEVISHGFWPGSGPVREAAFYAYAVPEPVGFADSVILPAAAYYHKELHEFILPYEAVRAAASPEAELRDFLSSTYDAGAKLGSWNREELEKGEPMSAATCAHLQGIKKLKVAKSRECEECVKTGSSWVHLRTCQTCGRTLCCDSSPNQHASAHARAAGHPVISSAEPGERWLYCYPDDAFEEY